MPGAQDHFPEIPTGELMSSGQAATLVALERAGGCLSLAAVCLLCAAYWLAPRVRNVQNTFIVFASVSNVGASVASIIAMDGLVRGKDSGLCRTQAFLFQMFMQSDPWWALSMAINVFLVFYFHVSPDSFQKWWWLYCFVCYGGPFVIALALLLVQNEDRGPIYGEATIWCWVDRSWDDIRIYTYYMLIWVCIAGSLLFYFMVGYHIFQSRNHLRSLSTNKSREAEGDEESVDPMFELPDLASDSTNANNTTFYGTVVTEVKVVHSNASTHDTSPSSTTPTNKCNNNGNNDDSNTNNNNNNYGGTPAEPKRAYLNPTVAFHDRRTSTTDRDLEVSAAATHFFSTVTSQSPPTSSHRHRRHHRHRHTKTGTTTTTSSSTSPSSSFLFFPLAPAAALRSLAAKFIVDDPIKRAYLRTSFLFALSVLVTWIPSSMNRIHSWLAGESPFEYHVATAAVLPLQGLWNAVIFFVTSHRAIREAVLDRWCAGSAGGVGGGGGGGGCRDGGRRDGPGFAADERGLGAGAGGAGGGGGGGPARRPARDDDLDVSNESDEADVGTLGSDVELRNVSEISGKTSMSL